MPLLNFLLAVQLYCPLDHEDDAFHRCLYVFCCPQVTTVRQCTCMVYVSTEARVLVAKQAVVPNLYVL